MVSRQENKTKVDIFEEVKFSGEVIDNIKIRNVGYAEKWKITLRYKGRQYTFDYTNSVVNFGKKPSKKDCIYALITDASCYESSRDLRDFAENFGYETRADAERAYKSCARTAEALKRVFGADLRLFEKELEDY